MAKYYSIMTASGLAAMTNAALLGNKVNITKFAVGDGLGAYYEPAADQMALKREKWSGTPTSVEIDPDNRNVMKISVLVPSTVGGFTVRELGLYSGDAMIAVSNCPDIQKIAENEGTTSELMLTMEIAVSNTDVIEFKIDPTVIIATKSDIKNHSHNGLDSKRISYDDLVGKPDFGNIAPDIMNSMQMLGGDALSTLPKATDASAQYDVVEKSTAATGQVFSSTISVPKGLYSVMLRMKISSIASTENILKLDIKDGQTVTTKYIKPSMFKAANTFATIGCIADCNSGSLNVTLSVAEALVDQTVRVDYVSIMPTMTSITSIG